jgi:hypothetical protein
MKESVLDRFGLEEYRKIRQQIVYDPSAANGLRWLYTKSGRRSTEVGKTFWIDGLSYQSSWAVLILNDQWPEEGQNVVKRTDTSGPWSDVANLEWAVHGNSRRQNAEQKRLKLVCSVLGHAEPFIDDRHRLNFLCANNHQWNGHPLSLQVRKGKSWKCEQCEKERQSSQKSLDRMKAWREQNKQEENRKSRERMAARLQDPEQRKIHNERTKACQAKRRATHGRESRLKGVQGLIMPPGKALTIPESGVVRQLVAQGHPVDWSVLHPLVTATLQMREALKGAGNSPSIARLVMDEQRRYWQKNPEAKKKHERWWDKYKYAWRYKCDLLFRLHECQRNSAKKARNRGNHTVKISKKEMAARFAEFGHCCAFCGSSHRLTIEHVVPRSKGGPHAIGNILPTCHSCNMSKTNHDPETWYRQQPFFSELRWRKICRVLGWTRSSVGQLALL